MASSGKREGERAHEDIVPRGFGGGCHWCTEAVFAALRGVKGVEQGSVCAETPDSFSEGVMFSFQPDEISLGILSEIHPRTHSCTSNHAMRGKYRTAIYAINEAQAKAARKIASHGETPDSIVTVDGDQMYVEQ